VTGTRPVGTGGVLFPTPTRKIPILSEAGAGTIERRTRSIPVAAIAAAGVVVLGIAWWLFGGGNAANPPAAEPPSTSAPAPAVPAPGPVTTTPPPPPAPKPVDLTVTWSEPFAIRQGADVISQSARRHSLQNIIAGTELYAHSDALRLHFRINTDKSDTVTVPPVGRLAVTLAPQFTNCWVVVDNKELRKGSILPGAPVPIASGRHVVSLKCADNKTDPTPESPQTVEVKPGLDPSQVNFPRGG
jgi:hypothetical protein